MNKLHRFRQIGTVLLCVVVLASLAMGAEDEPAGGHHKKTMFELFQATGFVGWLMVVTSVIGTTLTLQYIVSITREKLAPTELAEELEALMSEGNYDEAIELCDSDGGYLATIVGDGLRLRHAGYEHMIGALEQAAAEEAFKVNAKISYLSLLGNVAPLLGLLGTVTGMISSFQVIETLKAPTPGDLAKGVYESLVNTTMGLFIAIVFLVAYFFFKNKVTKMTLSINLQAVDLLKHLAPAEKPHGAAH
jgi:biopolymer transport protein ExbB